MVNKLSQIITTALGPVEVSFYGNGIPIIAVHGSPGGIDAAQMMLKFLPFDKFQSIILSRPGYLGTPLDSTDTSIDHEADLLAAVLDTLKITRAGVFAWSGGGPSAYRLAIRHPERITCLVQVAAISSRCVIPPSAAADQFLFGTRIGNWLVRRLVRYVPGRIITGSLASEGSLGRDELKDLAASVMADLDQRNAILDVATTISWTNPRKAGWNNDKINFAAIKSLELERVRCSVLLIHGEVDTDVILEYSHTAHSHLPDSKLIIMKRGTHLAFYAHPQAAEVQEQTRQWFSDHN